MYLNFLKKLSQTKYPVMVVIAAILLVIITSTVILLKLAAFERKRDLLNWENRLNIVADSRANAVNDWIQRQFSELDTLAHNPALQLYATQIHLAGVKEMEDPYQVSYLRNLLIAAAARSGFGAGYEQNLGANINMPAPGGIAILDKNKNATVTTNNMPELSGRLEEIINNFPMQEHYISSIYPGSDDKPSVVFSVPIFAVQGDEDIKSQIGSIVGIMPVDDYLFPLLKQPGDTAKTSETLLVKMEGNMVNYLSPTKDGSAALSKNLTTSQDLDAAFAIVNPGQFAIKRDYGFNEVLVTGRKISNTNWNLLYKINRSEALSESDTHVRNLLTIGIISIFFITASIIAMWQYANFLNESKIAARYRKIMLDLKSQKHILRLITDNRPEVTFIVDGKNRYRFANIKAAEAAGLGIKEMLGQSIINIMGKEKALPYIKMNAAALADGKTVTNVIRYNDSGKEKIVQSCHIPLAHIPSPDDGKYRDGVLVIEQDITIPIASKEKLVRTLNAVIDTLVAFMDMRDEYTANHSSRIALLAAAIAKELDLDLHLIETVTIAGKLMNLGRAFVPGQNLGNLVTKDNSKAKQKIINLSSELLKDIEFDGPVVETILQSGEYYNGKGEFKLKADSILLTARILAVADAFVSLLSPRAKKMAKSIDFALNEINKEVGKKFDRKIYAALVNYIENRDGRKFWESPV